ncbi:MAG TPA: glycosyltransferase [Candidatus Methylacidiphilales bacterium]
MIVSVIICTHNPRRDYLSRTLAALRLQTLPLDRWELVVVDNVSNPPLATTLDLSWHPQSRIVVESELGILPARVRGMKETQTPFILFVDDDNLLAPDYLETALAIADSHPFLGMWGGSITPEFEVPAPPWISGLEWLLACAEISRDRWSNIKFSSTTIPPTAGMCLRRPIADEFIRIVSKDPRRQALGRRGKEGLTNCEDTDLAWIACDMGFGTGQFARLKMTHLIPNGRLREDYLFRLYEGTACSLMLLEAIHGRPPKAYPASPLRALFGGWRRKLFWNRRNRILFECEMRARQRACEVYATWS